MLFTTLYNVKDVTRLNVFCRIIAVLLIYKIIPQEWEDSYFTSSLGSLESSNISQIYARLINGFNIWTDLTNIALLIGW